MRVARNGVFLLWVALAIPAGGLPAQRAQEAGVTRFTWGAYRFVVFPSEVSGVLVWLFPPRNSDPKATPVNFSSRFHPEDVMTWTIRIDSLIASRKDSAPKPALLNGLDSSTLSVFRRSNQRDSDGIYLQLLEPGAAPINGRLGIKGAELIRDAFRKAAPLSAVRPRDVPIDGVYHDVKLTEMQPPELISAPAPVYPRALLQAGFEGEVLTELVITASGTVDLRTVRVIWSDHSLFTDAALAVLNAARYQPGSIRGEPVRVLVRQPFTFGLRR